MTGTVPQKRLGKYYGVVLRLPDHSHGHVFVTGAFGANSSYPVVDFGTMCVCCNVVTAGRETLDPSTDRSRVSEVLVPVCDDCRDHALADNNTSIFLAGMLIFGVGGGLWTAGEGLWLACAIVSSVAAIVGMSLWGLRRARIAGTRDGHHPRLEHTVSPRQCLVRTTNHRLAQALAERHRPLVHRAK